nr:MAG TPA: hypothetical protein [Caudoviricetes sp.]
MLCKRAGYSGYTYFGYKRYYKNCLLLFMKKKYVFYIEGLKKQSVTETFITNYYFH